MANITGNGYVNRTYFTPGEKPRLNVDISETVGKKEDKNYINYTTTIWDDEAVYYNNLLGAEPKGVAVNFSGYITEILVDHDKKDSSKVYTKLRINLNKQFGGSAFNVIPDLRKGVKSNNTNLSDDDF